MIKTAILPFLRFLILSLSLIVIGLSGYSYAYDQEGHVADFIEHTGLDLSSPEGRECAEYITSFLLDDYRQFVGKVCKQSPSLQSLRDSGLFYQGASGIKYGHRIMFHWGAGGRIPFGYGPLNDWLRGLEKNGASKREIETLKDEIRREWHKRRLKMFELTKKFLISSGLDEHLAQQLMRPIATLLYDIHLLGDYKGKQTAALQPIETLKRDIINIFDRKNRKIFKSNPLIQELVKEIKAVDTTNEKIAAEKISNILKEKLRPALESVLGKKAAFILCKSVPVVGGLLRLSSKYNGIMNKIKNPNLRTAAKAGVLGGAISALSNTYKVIKGDSTIGKAIANTAEDTALVTGSVYAAEGLVQNFGRGRYAITVIVKEGVSKGVQATGAFLNYGVATFIFDESRSVWFFLKSEISTEEFIQETSINITKSLVSGGAAYCAVLLGAGPGGWVVIGVSIGSYLLVSKTISYIDYLNERNSVQIEDLLFDLPLHIQKRVTLLNLDELEVPTFLDPNSLPGREIIFDDKNSPTVLDPESMPGRTTILDY